jgi:predicted naringenin-chalcone synthase
MWEQFAPQLAVAAAREALAAWAHGSAADVTHVIVHSCTGFAAPGLDYHLIKALGLPTSTRKLGVNFMGCFGGFTSLYVAKQVVEADPTRRAVALCVCAETCSVHMSRDRRIELIVGNTLFADGAAAIIVAPAGFAGKGKPARPLSSVSAAPLDAATFTPAAITRGLVKHDPAVIGASSAVNLQGSADGSVSVNRVTFTHD